MIHEEFYRKVEEVEEGKEKQKGLDIKNLLLATCYLLPATCYLFLLLCLVKIVPKDG
jgi:hypothetical protein